MRVNLGLGGLCGGDQGARICDLLTGQAAQHAQKFQPLIIGGQPHTQPFVRALSNLPHQEPGWKHPTIARTDHGVAGAHIIGAFEKFQRGGGCIIAR